MDKKTWVITGVAGFIGSNILERLLLDDQIVIGVDSLLTGFKHNLTSVENSVGSKFKNFTFIEGDCSKLSSINTGVDYVLHQAALGSVPRSIKDPRASHDNNFNSFLQAIEFARLKNVKTFVFASSSSVHGNNGILTSPYAVSKHINELVASDFNKSFAMNIRALRYFNVFGPRQNPFSEYSAVIPRWVNSFYRGEEIKVFGDGETRRDFTYIDNVVSANILAATTPGQNSFRHFDIGCGESTSLNRLLYLILDNLSAVVRAPKITYLESRAGDIKTSLADIGPAKNTFGYVPTVNVRAGLELYLKDFAKKMAL